MPGPVKQRFCRHCSRVVYATTLQNLIIHDFILPLDMLNGSKVPLTTFFQHFDVLAITCFCFTTIKVGGNHYPMSDAGFGLCWRGAGSRLSVAIGGMQNMPLNTVSKFLGRRELCLTKLQEQTHLEPYSLRHC